MLDLELDVLKNISRNGTEVDVCVNKCSLVDMVDKITKCLG